MDTGNILQEMATCDFSAPLSVKIMYDDSDEEFHEDIITIPEQSFIENSSLPVKSEKDNIQIVQNKNVKEKPKSTNGTLTTNVKCEISKSPRKGVTAKKVVKRNSSAKTEERKKKLVIDDINNEKTEENMYFPHNVIISYSKNIINNNTVNDNVKTVKKQNKRANDYIDDLILTVSESLINIVGSYYKLADMVQLNKSNPLQLEDMKKQYKRIKYHFFQLSYCTIATIILDFQTHKCFSKDFLDNTIQIAKERNNVNYTIQQIKPFYDEMIAWAKMKRSWLHNLQLSNIYKSHEPDLPTLRQHLSEPSQQASIVINDNRSSQPNDITSAVAPNHRQNNQTCSSYDVSTHVTSNSLEAHVNAPLDPLRFKPVSNDTNTNNLPIRTINYINRDPNVYSTVHHPYMPNNNIQYQNHRETSHWYLENNQNINNFLHHTSPQAPHVAQFYDVNCPPSYNATWKWLTNGIVVGNQNQSNVSQAVPQNNVPQAAPQNNVPQAVPQNNVSHAVPKNNVSHAVPQDGVPFDTARSSVSTDSGLMSPLQFNHESTVVEEHQMTIPLITDVTSLNPAALHIVQGSCFVCGVSTKKMCLGCYQTYYCSFNCQRSHWLSHKALCKRSKESHVS